MQTFEVLRVTALVVLLPSSVPAQMVTKHKPLPAYPAASLAAGASGVAVADYRTDVTGRMAAVEILEAPDEHIAGVMRETLMRWVLEPSRIRGRENEPRPRRDTEILYFVIENGKGVVRRPEEMPGGPKPRPRPGAEPAGPPPAGLPPAGPPATAPSTSVSHGEDISEILEPALIVRATKERLVVVDTRVRAAYRRGHRDGAVNIPREELQTRGGIELRSHTLVVVDCTNDDMRWCRIAGDMLRRAGFKEVLLLVKDPMQAGPSGPASSMSGVGSAGPEDGMKRLVPE
jgi:rhodanese-related sulfurtransferase